jgi:hypothetical protein
MQKDLRSSRYLPTQSFPRRRVSHASLSLTVTVQVWVSLTAALPPAEGVSKTCRQVRDRPPNNPEVFPFHVVEDVNARSVQVAQLQGAIPVSSEKRVVHLLVLADDVSFRQIKTNIVERAQILTTGNTFLLVKLQPTFGSPPHVRASDRKGHVSRREASPKALLEKNWNPSRYWGSPFLRCTIPHMKKGRPSSSRRRSEALLGRKTFVYLTEDERKLVDEAAALERRSVSSFIANAAVEAAERVVSRPARKKT